MVKASRMATRKKAATIKTKRPRIMLNAKIWIIGFGLAIAIAAVVSNFWIEKNETPATDFMPIRVVEIEGVLNHVSRDQIMATLMHKSQKSVSGINTEAEVLGFFSSDLLLIEEQLEALAWLQKVELRRVWPDRLHIKIKEHKAIAYWNSDALINEYGGIFKPSDFTGLDALPKLTGPEPELSNMLETFKILQGLLVPIDMQLKVLNLNHRYAWSLQLANGIELEVGRKHLIQRVERFVALYPLLKRESDLMVAKVDLRYDTGLAVTRLETSELQASL